MSTVITVLAETKTAESRAPLTPACVKWLTAHGHRVYVQRSGQRFFPAERYESAGAVMVDGVPPDSQIILSVKRPHNVDFLRPGQALMTFAYTPYRNGSRLPIVDAVVERSATLVDYERIRDREGRRMIAFGRYAGIVAMVNALWAAREHFDDEVLARLERSLSYGRVGALFRRLGTLGPPGKPLRILVVGRGRCGNGAREVLEQMGLRELPLAGFLGERNAPGFCQIGTAEMVARRGGGAYDRAEFRNYGAARYTSTLADAAAKADILVQGNYWFRAYPPALSLEEALLRWDEMPRVFGDVTCFPEISLGVTLRATTIPEPCFTLLRDGQAVPGIDRTGITVTAVDNAPAELPLDSSRYFAKRLMELLPDVARLCEGATPDECAPHIRDAVAVFRGAKLISN